MSLAPYGPGRTAAIFCPNGPWFLPTGHARELTGEPPIVSCRFRSGFACLAGRPNVGKSTLTNALVGAKVAITSDRPQTTRRVIRGVVHRPDAQLILVDTPGLHKPRTLLGEHLDSLVRSTLAEVDVIGFCIPATDPVGPGDRFFARELENVKKTPVVVVVTNATRRRPSGSPNSWSR